MSQDDLKKPMEGLQVEDKKPEEQEDVVDPWTVQTNSETGIDYDKLISTIHDKSSWFLR